MKKMALGILAAIGLSTAAQAADMAVKARPAPLPVEVWNWGGFYVGLNLGGAWSDNRSDYFLALPAGTPAPLFANCGSPAGVPALVIAAGPNPFDLSASCDRSNSFIGGGQSATTGRPVLGFSASRLMEHGNA